jgi:hypothetical protein
MRFTSAYRKTQKFSHKVNSENVTATLSDIIVYIR